MYQIDNPSASPSQPASTAPGTPGFFTDGVPASAIPATVLPGEWCNSVMLELLNVLKAGGVAPSKNAFNQLAAAIQGGGINYAADTGAANAYAVALVNVPGALLDGMRVRFSANNANTGPSTLNVNGLGVKPIWGLNAQPLQGGEILAGSRVEVQWNGATNAWVLLSASGGAQQMGAGSYGVTAPQFDASTQLATDAFVQRALGNYSGYLSIGASRSILATDIGKAIYIAASGVTVTLPTPTSLGVPLGGAVTLFTPANYPAAVVPGSGATLNAPGVPAVASFVLNTGECATFVAVTPTVWQVTSSTAGLGQTGDFASALANPGWQKLPSGLILQWATVSTNGTTTITVTFPIAFPHAIFGDALSAPYQNLVGGQGATATTRTYYTTKLDGTTASSAGITFNYLAFGW